MPLHRFLAVLLLLSLALTGCNPGAAPTPPASATPEATATTPPSPTPRMTTEIQELRLLAGPQAGDWRVVGLVANRSSFAVRGVDVRVVLEGAAGTVLAEQLVPLALTNLAPGEVSPFTAR
ncbi:MAG: FxLYD domain-containing protein, partial [Anaerolineales bacterium]|nr:FxLYD domain-containing protein [Anaerolineales bacterium]